MRIVCCLVIIIFSTLAVAKDYSKLVAKFNIGEIDDNYILAQIKIESSNNPNAKSDKNCLGLMQIHLTSARDVGFKGDVNKLFVPRINIKYGIKYLYWIYNRYEGRKNRLYASFDAYNRGIGNVRRWPYQRAWQGHRYVGKIIKVYEKLK